MTLDRLVVASRNPGKVSEIESLLAGARLGIDVVRPDPGSPEVEETETTLAGNARLKARAAHGATGLPALADDTGLEVDALDGAPGVLTARYAGPDVDDEANMTRLLAEMEGVGDRRATFRTVIVVVDGSTAELVVSGELRGAIARSRRGSTGFGYDPVFEVGGRTLAEMGPGEKNRISHRARALDALVAALHRR